MKRIFSQKFIYLLIYLFCNKLFSQSILTRINKIDNIVKIGSNNFFIFNKDYTEIADSMFTNSLILDKRSVFVLSKNKSQLFTASGKETDGYWNQYFTIQFKKNLNIEKAIFYNKSEFTANSFFKLGMSNKSVIYYMKNLPDCILRYKNTKIYNYYYFEKNSVYFRAYGYPQYIASFIFENDILLKFGFGLYFAQSDPDFRPTNYRILKGKLFK